jgi:hypothetical protein
MYHVWLWLINFTGKNALDASAVESKNLKIIAPEYLVLRFFMPTLNFEGTASWSGGRKKATTVYGMAQKICPIRQSWGEAVPINFELNFV